MGRSGLTWLLLLTLGCLVHCVRSEDSTVSPTTKASPTEPPPTAASTAAQATTVKASPTAAPVQSTAAAAASTAPPVITERQTTQAPTAAAAPSSTAPPPKPTTTTPPTTPAPAAATSKTPTPSGSVGAVIVTTVSKVDQNTSGPKSSSQSPPGPPPPAVTTMPGPTPAQTQDITTIRPPILTTTLGTGSRVLHPPGGTGTTKVTNAVPVPTATVTGAVPSDATSKHDTRHAAGTSAVVTSKPSPDQNLDPTGSTAPPTGPHIPESTSKPSAAVTGGKSGLDPVLVGSTQSGVQTTDRQTTVPPTTSTTVTTAAPKLSVFSYSLNKGHQSEEKDLVSLCQRLMPNLEDGNCTISYRYHHDKIQFVSVVITGKVKTNIVSQLFDDITKKPTDNRTLITILASCGALLIMIIILAVCASHHRKPYSENQMHLTEELQTVENGYHDNPTLEVMEVGADMQEKKPPLSLNNGGEFNDSWIVPIDNLLKEEGPDEEDTHL